ncbi:condensation domain protein [Mycobacterium xenopi 4042]|uniref:Condensation domain protein n=1 Tax=Mycobacterium xenopi 4042 TaxID=1299334 RepID=X8BLI3_MYCXE|nr:condensation domain protein [Mycobacterium xenopi 4042]
MGGRRRQLVLVIHHLVVDAVSWRILLEDLNTAWFQHRSGQPTTLPATGTSYARWASLLTEYAHRPTSSTRPTRGSSWRPHRLCCPRCGPSSTRSPPPGTCRRGWIPTPPAAVGRGVHGVSCRGARALADRLALAVAEFVGNGPCRSVSTSRPRPPRGTRPRHRFVAHGRVVHDQTPGVAGSRWAVVGAGSRRRGGAGALIKDAKEQLRALPHPLSYGALRYLTPTWSWPGGSADRVQLPGRLGVAAEASDESWRLSATACRWMRPRRSHAASPHRRAERRHRRHRQRRAAVRRLDVGTVVLRSRRGRPLSGCGCRLWPESARTCEPAAAADPLRHCPGPAHPAANRRASAALRDRRRAAADALAAGTALPRRHRAGRRRRVCGADAAHVER